MACKDHCYPTFIVCPLAIRVEKVNTEAKENRHRCGTLLRPLVLITL
jgi:hypothetical protein